MDAMCVNMYLDDLNTAIGGGILKEHTSYRLWSDRQQSLRNDAEARASVEWQVSRLKLLQSHPKSLWPEPRPHVTSHYRYRHIFHCPDNLELRRQHADIAPSAIFKVSLAITLVRAIESPHVPLIGPESCRSSMSFTPAHKSHLLGNEATDVAGPTYSVAFELLEIRNEETAISILQRIQNLQGNWTKHAAAP
jgi:hypothetical protein